MTIRDPETQEKAFGALTFGVFTSTNAVPAWDVSDDQIAERLTSGILEYQRAACYLASGDKPHALEWFAKAFTKNPADERVRGRLVELYFEKKQYPKVAEVYSKGGINPSTDEQTITRFAESFDKSGDVRKAVAVLEAGTTLKPGSGPLLLALAEYYKKTGEAQKASAAEQKGRQLMSSHPES
jgi:tetratricopeptide (TPR) repeat protein